MFALKANSQQDMVLYILVVTAVYLAFFRTKSYAASMRARGKAAR
jgi:hypothetical protein